MAKVNTNSSREIRTVASAYIPKTRETIVSIKDDKGTIYFGQSRWNPSDPFDPAVGFKNAYERAVAKIPKPNIIEKCGGLRNGDWVCVNYCSKYKPIWGIVCDNKIYYVIGNGNWDMTTSFSDGNNTNGKIIEVIRPLTTGIITLDTIKDYERTGLLNRTKCKIYKVD